MPPHDSSIPTQKPDPSRAWHDARISYYPHVTAVQSARQPTMRAGLYAIGSGAFAAPVRRARTLLQQQGQQAYDGAKAELPGYCFAGTFRQRGIAHLRTHSGIVHGDLDHLDDLEAVYRAYASDPHVAYCFTSPSGHGLKVGVLVALVATPGAYTHAWHAVSQAYTARYGVSWDPSGKDIARLCFVSHDPALYIQDRPAVFPVPPAPEPPPPRRPAMPQTPLHGERSRVEARDRPGDAANARLAWADILTPAGWRLERQQGDTAYWTRPGKTRGISATTDGGGEQVLYVFSSNAPPFDPDTSYTRFGAYTLLHHDGDYHAAAQALAEQFTLPHRGTAGQARTPDFIDSWMGPRSEWCGVPTTIRRAV